MELDNMKGRKNTMLNTKQQEFVDHAKEKFGTNELTVSELKEANKKFGCKYAPQWLIKNSDYKVGKSLFRLPTEDGESVSKTTFSKGISSIVLSNPAFLKVTTPPIPK